MNAKERFQKEFYEGLYSCNESDGEMSDCFDDVWDWHTSILSDIKGKVPERFNDDGTLFDVNREAFEDGFNSAIDQFNQIIDSYIGGRE